MPTSDKLGRRKGTSTMARSRRHTPIASITTAANEKQDKRWANRIHRSATGRAVRSDASPDATVEPRSVTAIA